MDRGIAGVGVSILFACSIASANQTVFWYDSDENDYVGQGQEATLGANDFSFSVSRNFDNGVSVRVNNFSTANPQDFQWWDLAFAAPNEVPLAESEYQDAERFPFQSIDQPGLSASGNGRGCNTLTGQFEVLEAVYDAANGDVVSFAADFEQNCEGQAPVLSGSIRYNSGVPLPWAVAGTLSGVDASRITCRNVTTGQRVRLTLDIGDTQFDCSAAGLAVNPGDDVRIYIRATAQ